MKSILIEMQCPTCMWHTHISSDTFIIPAFEPDLKKQLLDGTFFLFECPRCHQKIHFFHTCLYFDKNHHFVLLMKNEAERNEADQLLYQGQTLVKRYLSSNDNIAEKIRILEDEVDDHVIELMKVKLYLHYKKDAETIQQISYHDYDQDSKTFWFCLEKTVENEFVAVQKTSYDKLKKQLEELDNQHFVQINLAWAIQYLKNHCEM